MSKWEEISRYLRDRRSDSSQILGISESLGDNHATSSHFDVYLLYQHFETAEKENIFYVKLVDFIFQITTGVN